VKIALYAHPDGWETGHDEQGRGLPAASPPAGRPQPCDHADHEGEPGDAADPFGRTQGAGPDRPEIHGRECLVTVWSEGGSARERNEVPNAGDRGNTSRKQEVEGSNGRKSRLAHRGVHTGHLAVSNRPRSVDGLSRVNDGRPTEQRNNAHEQRRRCTPPEGARPRRERSHEPRLQPRDPKVRERVGHWAQASRPGCTFLTCWSARRACSAVCCSAAARRGAVWRPARHRGPRGAPARARRRAGGRWC